jgi:hypothetical protein
LAPGVEPDAPLFLDALDSGVVLRSLPFFLSAPGVCCEWLVDVAPGGRSVPPEDDDMLPDDDADELPVDCAITTDPIISDATAAATPAYFTDDISNSSLMEAV